MLITLKKKIVTLSVCVSSGIFLHKLYTCIRAQCYWTTRSIDINCRIYLLIVVNFKCFFFIHATLCNTHKKEILVIKLYDCFLFFVFVWKADGTMGKVLPFLFYGVVTLCVAVLSLKLPETRMTKLPQQVTDINTKDPSMYVMFYKLE